MGHTFASILLGLYAVMTFVVIPAMLLRMVWQKLHGRYIPFVAQNDTSSGESFSEELGSGLVLWAVMIWTTLSLAW